MQSPQQSSGRCWLPKAPLKSQIMLWVYSQNWKWSLCHSLTSCCLPDEAWAPLSWPKQMWQLPSCGASRIFLWLSPWEVAGGAESFSTLSAMSLSRMERTRFFYQAALLSSKLVVASVCCGSCVYSSWCWKQDEQGEWTKQWVKGRRQ